MEIATEKYKGFTIHMWLDEGQDSPATWGNYTIAMAPSTQVISEGAKWGDYVDDDGMPTDETVEKIQTGHVFPISYSSHGPQSSYALAYDSSDADGYIEFTDEYAQNFDDLKGRREMAKSDLEEYTRWANGECYGFTMENPQGEPWDDNACWGYIGYEYALEDAKAGIERYLEYDQPSHHAKHARELHK